MGRKPVVGLAGLVLASATLSGCFWDKNETQSAGNTGTNPPGQTVNTQRTGYPQTQGQQWNNSTTANTQMPGTTPPQNFRPTSGQYSTGATSDQNNGISRTSAGQTDAATSTYAGRTNLMDPSRVQVPGQVPTVDPSANNSAFQQPANADDRRWNTVSSQNVTAPTRAPVQGLDAYNIQAPARPVPVPPSNSQMQTPPTFTQPGMQGGSTDTQSYAPATSQAPTLRTTQYPGSQPTMVQPPAPYGTSTVPVLPQGANSGE